MHRRSMVRKQKGDLGRGGEQDRGKGSEGHLPRRGWERWIQSEHMKYLRETVHRKPTPCAVNTHK